MPKLWDDDIRLKLEEIDRILAGKYKLSPPKEEMDWRTYEQKFSSRIKNAMKELDPLIKEAVPAEHHPQVSRLHHHMASDPFSQARYISTQIR